jgi:nitroimidazol reductase NimA-like FMN-containing flavoprotein (pyridoxamine 5'-phosphate oxidase superfamily)
MFGKLNVEESRSLLKRHILGRIGCHAEGKTYVVPISYAFDGEDIYCHSFEGMKLHVMRKNPKVCFQVDQMANMANWESVVAWGTFEEITDPVKRKQALNILLDRIIPVVSSATVRLSPDWPFPPKDAEKIEGVIFRIRLDEITGRFEKADSIYLASFG